MGRDSAGNMKAIWMKLTQNDQDVHMIHVTVFFQVVFLRTDYMGDDERFFSIRDLAEFESVLKSHLLDDDLTFNAIHISIDERDSDEDFALTQKTSDALNAPVGAVLDHVQRWFNDASSVNLIPAVRITWTQTKPTETRSVLIFPWPRYYEYQQLVAGLADFVISNSQDNRCFFVKDIHALETEYYKSIKGQLSIMNFLPKSLEIALIVPGRADVKIGEMTWEAREYGDDLRHDKRNRLHNYHQTGFAADWASQEFDRVMREFFRYFNNDIPFVKEEPDPQTDNDDYAPLELSAYEKAIRIEIGLEKECSIVPVHGNFILDTRFTSIQAATYAEVFSILASKYFNVDTFQIVKPERINVEVYEHGRVVFDESYYVFHDDFFEFCEEYEDDVDECTAELTRMAQESFNVVTDVIQRNL